MSLADWATAFLSLRDITFMHDEVQKFIDVIPEDHAWHGLSFVAVAEKLIQEDAFIHNHPSLRAKCKNSGELKFYVSSKKTQSVVTRREYSQSPIVVPVTTVVSFGLGAQRKDPMKSTGMQSVAVKNTAVATSFD